MPLLCFWRISRLRDAPRPRVVYPTKLQVIRTMSPSMVQVQSSAGTQAQVGGPEHPAGLGRHSNCELAMMPPFVSWQYWVAGSQLASSPPGSSTPQSWSICPLDVDDADTLLEASVLLALLALLEAVVDALLPDVALDALLVLLALFEPPLVVEPAAPPAPPESAVLPGVIQAAWRQPAGTAATRAIRPRSMIRQ